MKKFLLPTIAMLIIASFTFATNEAQKSFATVNQEQGLYIFTDCRPNSEFKVLGTLTASKVSLDLNSMNAYQISYDELKQDIFKQISKKKNKEKYNEADAVILYPDKQKADVIKFK